MSKVSIDLEYIKTSLSNIGYIISDCIERENNGLNWQLKFSNSGAIVTIYDTNTKKNTVANGKCEPGESNALKAIIDGLKCKEIRIDPINERIVQYINAKSETAFYDYKQQWQEDDNGADLLHDILCLANNTEGKEAYLIVGVTDSGEIEGLNEWRKSNEVYDYLRSKEFAGGTMPEIELRQAYYTYHKIDVLIIKQSKYVPFYLKKQYRGIGVQIYTRVGDTNTPRNEVACYSDVEKLWRIHFERENI